MYKFLMKKSQILSALICAAAFVSALLGVSCKAGGKNLLNDNLGYYDPNFDLTKKHITFNNPAAIEPRSTIIKIYAEEEITIEWPNIDPDGNTLTNPNEWWEQQIAAGIYPPPIPGRFSPGDPNYSAEEGFMYVDGAPYYCDYAVNPLELPGIKATIKYYVPRFKDWDGNTSPTRTGIEFYDFRGWSTTRDTDFRDRVTGKLPADLTGYLALSAGSEFPSTVIDYSVFALWDENSSAEGQKDRLKEILSELAKPPATQTTYNDEFLIGNGDFAGDAENAEDIVKELTESLQLLVEEAESLLQGELRTVTIEISEKNPDGSNKTEEMQFIVYNFGRMGEIANNIEAVRNDPRFDPNSFIPKTISLSYKEYPTTDPNNIYQNETAGAGRVQSITVTKSGTYEIELWGASGGHTWGKNNLPGLGGKGGHIKGTVTLTEGQVLKFFVGGEGEGTATAQTKEQNGQVLFEKLVARYPKDGNLQTSDTSNANFKASNPGGWNGGGKGGYSANAYPGAGSGGGATDVRLLNVNNNNGAYSYDKDITGPGQTSGNAPISLRIMVAGGGGGSAQIAEVPSQWWPGIRGGWADDICYSGSYRGAQATSKNNNQLYQSKYSDSVTYWYGITAGMKKTDTATEYDSTAKSSGHEDWSGFDGADATGGAAEGTGGGGGGYKGGAALINNSSGHSTTYTASGSGGTNWFDSVVVTPDADYQTPGAKANNENEDPRINHVYGHGRARIRYVNLIQ